MLLCDPQGTTCSSDICQAISSLSQYFTLHTDHGSLTWLCNFKEPEGKLARWLEQLQEYDYTIVHRSGRKHGNADALSRMPCKQCGRVTLEETEQEILIITRNPDYWTSDINRTIKRFSIGRSYYWTRFTSSAEERQAIP